MIGVGPGWEGTYGEPPLRPVNRRLAPTQVRILVLPPPRRPADTWSPSGPGQASASSKIAGLGLVGCGDRLVRLAGWCGPAGLRSHTGIWGVAGRRPRR